MQKFTLIITLLFISHAHAGLTEWYFQQQDINCQSSDKWFVPELTASNQDLVSRYGGDQTLLEEVPELGHDQKKVRQYLETQLYVENASKKILQQTATQTEIFKQIKKDLNSKTTNITAQKWKSDYVLLKALKEQFKKSKDEAEKATAEMAMANLVNANPLFSHPIFQEHLNSSFDQSFEEVLNLTISQSLMDLDRKQKKYQSYLASPKTQEKMDSLLDDPQTISEFIAINYSPADQIITNKQGLNQIVSLNYAKCAIQQKHIAQHTDQIMANFAKDAFLVAIPFGIKGKMTAAIKMAKATQALLQARRARGVLIAAESLYLTIDTMGLHKAQNRCEELSAMISQQVELPNALSREAAECQELFDSLHTSYALAVLGGTAAVKLSKYDVIDIRKSRVLAQGKETLLQASSTVKATLIKQADIIKQQLDQLESSLNPEPVLAMSAQDQKIVERFDRKITRIKEKEVQAESIKTEPEKMFKDIFQDDVNQINCPGPCKKDFASLKPGLEKLGETPEGRKLYQRYIDLFKGSGFQRLSLEARQLLGECLKVVKARFDCNPFQQEATLRLVEHPRSPPLPRHFIRRALASLKNLPTQKNLDRSLTLLTDIPQSMMGTIKSGALTDKARLKKMQRSLDPSTSYFGYALANEAKAIKLLRRLGYQIDIVPVREEERKISGIQDKFKKLAQEDALDPHKNADLILNDDFIADIYCPQNVTIEKASVIAEGILFKTESRNFKKTLSISTTHPKQNVGKRQTNRVIVYVSWTMQDIDKIAQAIRQEIVSHRPEYLQEAFIIFEKNGNLRQISLWP